MKLLENPRLAAITAYLSERQVSERVILGRIEAFSCKRAGQDKKLSKRLDQQFQEELASSPGCWLGSSPLGTLSDSTSRRLFIDLISTLNASFPDYDFSSLRPEQFTKELGPDLVVRSINSQLADFVEPEILEDLWLAVEDAVQIINCQVFSYVPDLDSDPFSDRGTIWSFNYFFFNKHLKRILYFTCLAKQSSSYIPEATDLDDTEAEDDFFDDFDDDELMLSTAPRIKSILTNSNPIDPSPQDDAFDEDDDFNMEPIGKQPFVE